MKEFSEAFNGVVANATELAASLDDKSLQKGLLNVTKTVAQQMKQLLQISRAVSGSPEDHNLNELLSDAEKAVVAALAKLKDASSGAIPTQMESFYRTGADNMEDLAEKELQGASDNIEKCVEQLQLATEAARERMVAKQVDIDEQNITEAILESCQAIAKSTAVLIQAATAVQLDYNKLANNPQSKVAYKRDPQWAQGLISAARTVTGSVQHLVKAANAAAQGEASEEALIVAAQSVSAATTQLVTASSVTSANVSTGNQSRLTDSAKKVAAATASLVKAAKDAATYSEEQQRDEDEAAYGLSESKIREMEQQMAILRLEKQLEKAKANLVGKNNAKTATKAAPRPLNPASQVKWKQGTAQPEE